MRQKQQHPSQSGVDSRGSTPRSVAGCSSSGVSSAAGADRQALTVDLLRPRTYLHLVRGELSALDVALKAGDALALTHHPHLKLFATEPAEFLLFDLAE